MQSETLKAFDREVNAFVDYMFGPRAYLLCIWLGNKFMKNRSPFSLRPHLIVYNLGITLLSFYMLIESDPGHEKPWLTNVLDSMLILATWEGGYNLQCQNLHSAGEADIRIQFLLTIVHTLSAAVKPCGFPFGCLMFQSSYMATLVILFINFYIKTYQKAPSRTAVKETSVTTEIKNESIQFDQLRIPEILKRSPEKPPLPGKEHLLGLAHKELYAPSLPLLAEDTGSTARRKASPITGNVKKDSEDCCTLNKITKNY
ncbi:hypothetical protein IHE44_0000648 [Lamprotornis superbus]|uniref:Elongation of very long chain fatty acids protein n=1 Tax=Lamprotornis superbus TaxID=245042 RepID=A0A835P1K4_9PASS|nr:hypothetical protein IHE44_0000648 [Lamprotornis superbus]